MQDMKWVEVGAEVAIINTGGWSYGRIVGTSTIAKIGKRDIALANGRKYRAADGSEQGRDKHYGDQIVPVDDRRVLQITAAKARQEAENKARDAVETWAKGRDGRQSPKNIREVIKQMQDLLTVLDANPED